MILTPEEQTRLATLKAQIAERVEALKQLRRDKRRIEFAGYQRAHRAKGRNNSRAGDFSA